MGNLSLVLVLGLVITSLSFAANCGGSTPCNCGDTLTSSRTLNTADDLTGCTVSPALTIGSNSVTLDCNGHSISRSGSTSGIGVYIYDKDYVTVEDCIISGFLYGIYNRYGQDNTYDDNIMISCTRGIYASETDDLVVRWNIINASIYGVSDYYGTDSDYYYNNVYSGTYGFKFYKTNAYLYDNEINAYYDVNTYKLGNNVLLRYNTLYANGTYAVYNNQPDNVDARYNYWKYTNGADIPDWAIPSVIYDYYDDSDYGIVSYLPRKP